MTCRARLLCASLQTQLTGLNDRGVLVGYFYNTNNGVPVDNQFGFYVKDGVYTEVNNPKTPGLFGNPAPASGVLIENQLIGVNDRDIAVGFYNDAAGNTHGLLATLQGVHMHGPHDGDFVFG